MIQLTRKSTSLYTSTGTRSLGMTYFTALARGKNNIWGILQIHWRIARKGTGSANGHNRVQDLV